MIFGLAHEKKIVFFFWDFLGLSDCLEVSIAEPENACDKGVVF